MDYLHNLFGSKSFPEEKNGTMVTIGRHQMFNVRQQDSKESHQVFDSYL